MTGEEPVACPINHTAVASVCGVLCSPGKDIQTSGTIFCDLVTSCLPLEMGLVHKVTHVGLNGF